MVNFGPPAAEICWRVWSTPANFNGFRVLAALLHGTLVVSVSQTLRRRTEGAIYIQQGGHHVGHWPTFLVLLFFLKVQNAKKLPKIVIWAPSHNFVGPFLRKWGTYRQSEKNLLSSNMSSRCLHNMVTFGPLAADIGLPVWAPQLISTAFASWQRYCTAVKYWASAKLYGVEQRAPPMFGRAAITLSIGPHSSSSCSSCSFFLA